jgi:predicted alpha/beta hydrolase
MPAVEAAVIADPIIEDITIAARDGYPLAATKVVPAGRPRAAVLINSATAVPRRIYRGFAAYLAEHSFAAVTYDYRGVAGSRPASLAGFAVRMRDWAALDTAAAIDHARRAWPDVPLLAVGHSFGGQAIGLAPNNGEISRALLIAAQAGHWRLFHAPEKYRVYVMMRIVGSAIAHAMGYVPGWTGIGEDIPKGVFLEWTGWVMKPRYFFDDPTLEALANFPRYRGPLRAICLTDDPWATAPAVDLLCSGFTGTTPERLDIHPRDIGVPRIGHFGFFRPENRQTLWRAAADWLRADETEARALDAR